MVARLVQGPASMKELAAPLGIALPSALKHLQVLESGGIVSSQKAGRVRTFAIERHGLETIEHWLAEHRRHLETGFDRLEHLMRSLPEDPSQ